MAGLLPTVTTNVKALLLQVVVFAKQQEAICSKAIDDVIKSAPVQRRSTKTHQKTEEWRPQYGETTAGRTVEEA